MSTSSQLNYTAYVHGSVVCLFRKQFNTIIENKHQLNDDLFTRIMLLTTGGSICKQISWC